MNQDDTSSATSQCTPSPCWPKNNTKMCLCSPYATLKARYLYWWMASQFKVPHQMPSLWRQKKRGNSSCPRRKITPTHINLSIQTMIFKPNSRGNSSHPWSHNLFLFATIRLYRSQESLKDKPQSTTDVLAVKVIVTMSQRGRQSTGKGLSPLNSKSNTRAFLESIGLGLAKLNCKCDKKS